MKLHIFDTCGEDKFRCANEALQQENSRLLDRTLDLQDKLEALRWQKTQWRSEKETLQGLNQDLKNTNKKLSDSYSKTMADLLSFQKLQSEPVISTIPIVIESKDLLDLSTIDESKPKKAEPIFKRPVREFKKASSKQSKPKKYAN
jgi:predicted nuclease with TOPRIM domain